MTAAIPVTSSIKDASLFERHNCGEHKFVHGRMCGVNGRKPDTDGIAALSSPAYLRDNHIPARRSRLPG